MRRIRFCFHDQWSYKKTTILFQLEVGEALSRCLLFCLLPFLVLKYIDSQLRQHSVTLQNPRHYTQVKFASQNPKGLKISRSYYVRTTWYQLTQQIPRGENSYSMRTTQKQVIEQTSKGDEIFSFSNFILLEACK